MKDKDLNKNIFKDAVKQSFVKLTPQVQIKNPVMFVVYIGAMMTSILFLISFVGIKDEHAGLHPGDCFNSLVHRAVCKFC